MYLQSMRTRILNRIAGERMQVEIVTSSPASMSITSDTPEKMRAGAPAQMPEALYHFISSLNQ